MSIVARRVTFGATPKYLNKPTETEDGITHASKKEAKRWADLQLLQKAGRIRDLERQVVFDLKVNGNKVCKYIADFVYTEYEHGQWSPVVEDAKGWPTPVYKLKRKLMKAIYGIEIRES